MRGRRCQRVPCSHRGAHLADGSILYPSRCAQESDSKYYGHCASNYCTAQCATKAARDQLLRALSPEMIRPSESYSRDTASRRWDTVDYVPTRTRTLRTHGRPTKERSHAREVRERHRAVRLEERARPGPPWRDLLRDVTRYHIRSDHAGRTDVADDRGCGIRPL